MPIKNNITCNFIIQRAFDSIENKELMILEINCEKCPFLYKIRDNFFFDNPCFNNLIKLFKENPSITVVSITTIDGEFELTTSQIDLFKDYGTYVSRLFNLEKPNLIENISCVKKIECKDKQNFLLERLLGNKFNDGLIFSDPIASYLEIIQEIKIYNNFIIKKVECQNCYKLFIQFLTDVRDLLENTEIIKSFLLLNNKNRPISELYSLIFGYFKLFNNSSEKNLILIDTNSKNYFFYEIGPYKIKIMKKLESNDYFYSISSLNINPSFMKIYNQIIQKIKENPDNFFDNKKPQKLNFLLKYNVEILKQLIKSEYGHLSDDDISKLSKLVLYNLMNFDSLMALLLDDQIEEIFLDSPKSSIYLDHRQFGRCETEILLTPTEIESFKTRLRMESEERLDETKPFLKTEIITQYFHIRVTIQIYPLSIDGFSLSIRKIHKNYLTLIDLIKNNTLSIEAATYLIFNFIHGRCILVIGEPYSGKTTLINSLDMIGKKNWRKIYIEDVIESIDQSSFGIHQVRFQVDSEIKSSENYSSKSFQVKECLHRTPDTIFIGELIHSKSIESFFFLLKVGLRRCLATAHGESPELIIERFIYDDHIPLTLIGNLDIVVQMNRINMNGQIIRRITRIIEVKKENKLDIYEKIRYFSEDLNLDLINIYLRKPENDKLIGSYNSLDELFVKSEVINKINSLRGENIDNLNFNTEFKGIQTVLEGLMKENKRQIGDIIEAFHHLWQNLELNNVPDNFQS